MDGILVQDSDWSRKLSVSLYDLLKRKLLCDLGIVCSAQNDVTNIKSNEVVMVHRCVLSAASETIKHLSVGGQVYNLVKINGVNISIQCWDKVLEFVYCGQAIVEGVQLCDIKRAAQVLQIKALERAADLHHTNYSLCVCPSKEPTVISKTTTDRKFVISSEKWTSELFEAMLDLLVKQTLCNMTIITEKSDKTSAEILAHLCMLVAASGTIRELVLQGADTYNSVKIDSIAYNTWLYLLEYIYTSRVSIVKSNIPEVWVASQLLQIDGLANAVSPFASQITTRNLSAVSNQDQSATIHTPEQSKKTQDPTYDMATNQDFINLKAGSLERDSPSAVVNDENSLGLSLNSDSCDTQSTVNPLDLPSEQLNSDQTVDGSAIDANSMLGEMDSSGIKLESDFPSGLSSPDNGSSMPAASQMLHNAQLVPVQTSPRGIVQASPQIVSGMGQWIQTMGLDGNTPTMLWLPQGMIPVVSPTQVQAQTSATCNTTQDSSGIDTPSTNASSPTEGTSATANSSKTPTKSLLYFCRKCESVFSESSYLDKHKCSSGVQLESVSSTRAGTVVHSANMSPKRTISVLQSKAVSSTRGIRAGPAANKLQCKFCMKIFSRTWTLNVHMRTHTGERPYICTVCNKAFSDKSNMRQHTLIHTENKQYKCPNCHQAFGQKRYMKKHFVETCRRKTTESDGSGEKEQADIEAEIVETKVFPSSNSILEQSKERMIVYHVQNKPSGEFAVSKTIKAEVFDGGTSNSNSRWDTSIIMSGDDVAMSRDEDTDSEHAQCESPEPEDPLLCTFCKKRFKTPRQMTSHRCKYNM